MPEHKTMVFVDGENFAYRGASELAEFISDDQQGPFYEPKTFLWIPSLDQARQLGWYGLNYALFPPAIRSYYFTAQKTGNVKDLEDVQERLKRLDFDPNVYPKRGRKEGSKLVDQALTVAALHHAYQDNFDTAIIISGDADYIPLIHELKGMGKRVHLVSFTSIVPDDLRRSADRFIDITPVMSRAWKTYTEQGLIKKIYPNGIIEDAKIPQQ